MSCLEEAAAEARKVRDYNDERRSLAARERAQNPVQAAQIDRETAARSLEIASILTALAAIERGLPPGCCHETPEEAP